MNTSMKIKAICLLSGGLDSALAARIIQDQGIDVYGIFFALPWKCGKLSHVQKIAAALKIPLHIEYLREDFINMVRNARYGYGVAYNPCTDCHIFMVKKAGEYAREIGADFVVTGEVLGQRPMSQLRANLRLVEEQSGMAGRLLRPLSAKLLEPTKPELERLVDREMLFNISGRSRKEQFLLAEKYRLEGFAQPAGGCLLTDRNFAARLKDLFQYGYRDWNDLVMLEWGRHFRIDKQFKALAGRDDNENRQLLGHANPADYVFEMRDLNGPTVVLQGLDPALVPSQEILSIAAGLVQHFSHYKNTQAQEIIYWQSGQPKEIKTIAARVMSDGDVESIWTK